MTASASSASQPAAAIASSAVAARPLREGGSRNATAQRKPARGGRVASHARISARALSPRDATLRRRIASASRSRSKNTTSAAPRDRASRPRAPVPAKASSTAAPANGMPSAARRPCERMSNSASGARSLVGLTLSPGGANSRRPRCLPPTIRIDWTCCSELLGQHLPRHLGDLAARQIAELERPEGEPDQPGDREPQMFEHAAHLTVLALAQGQCDPGGAALPAFEARAYRAIGNAVDLDALLESGEPVRIDFAMDADLVAPQPSRRRQLKAPGEPAIVGQQQQALGIEIEATYRYHPR